MGKLEEDENVQVEKVEEDTRGHRHMSKETYLQIQFCPLCFPPLFPLLLRSPHIRLLVKPHLSRYGRTDCVCACVCGRVCVGVCVCVFSNTSEIKMESQIYKQFIELELFSSIGTFLFTENEHPHKGSSMYLAMP